MSREPSNIVEVPIKITGLVNELCFSSLVEFLQFLQSNVVAEVPSSITNVHIGFIQPESTERSDLWIQLNSDGKFVAAKMFDGATWSQIPFGAPGEIYWISKVGVTSDDIPTALKGFKLVDTDNASVSSGDITHIMSFYNPGTPPYTYFAVTWEGF